MDFYAGYAYVVYSRTTGDPEVNRIADNSEGIVLRNVKVTATEPQEDSYNGVHFSATYSPRVKSEGETIYEIKEKQLRKLEDGESISGFRGYISLTSGTPEPTSLVFVNGNGEETGIGNIYQPMEQKNEIYSIDGLRVTSTPRPGIYIVNGKKTVIR